MLRLSPDSAEPDQEDDDGDLEDLLAPVEVRDLAVQGRGQRGGEQVRRHHPRQVIEPVQVAHDGGEGGGHDGLVQGGQEHPQHEAAQDDQDLAVRQSSAGLVLGDGAV